VLSVGDSISETYLVDADLVARFADVVGDANPLHLDPVAASQSRFGRPIAHGTLIMSFISGLLGQRLPGPGSIYLLQHSEYRSPVYVGDEVTITLTVVQLYSRRVARVQHEAKVGERLAVTGYSDVLLPSRTTHEATDSV
jgi:3-hydroxybutyryl-CoA dehydratase